MSVKEKIYYGIWLAFSVSMILLGEFTYRDPAIWIVQAIFIVGTFVGKSEE